MKKEDINKIRKIVAEYGIDNIIMCCLGFLITDFIKLHMDEFHVDAVKSKGDH